jgi:hypothetical protein
MTQGSPVTGCYETLAQKPFESSYLYVDAVIGFPVEQVWAQAVHIGRWMTDHRLVTIAGEGGEIGHFERVYPQELAADVAEPRYHLYGIAALVPFKSISLEVFPENGGSYGKDRRWLMFDEILLADLGGRTHVAVLMIEIDLTAEPAEPAEGWQEPTRLRMTRYLQNLQAVVQAANNN